MWHICVVTPAKKKTSGERKENDKKKSRHKDSMTKSAQHVRVRFLGGRWTTEEKLLLTENTSQCQKGRQGWLPAHPQLRFLKKIQETCSLMQSVNFAAHGVYWGSNVRECAIGDVLGTAGCGVCWAVEQTMPNVLYGVYFFIFFLPHALLS